MTARRSAAWRRLVLASPLGVVLAAGIALAGEASLLAVKADRLPLSCAACDATVLPLDRHDDEAAGITVLTRTSAVVLGAEAAS